MLVTVRTPGRQVFTVLVDARLEFGRDCDGVIVADPRVSRRHVALDARNDRVVVTDLDSSNGTMVDGVAICEPTALGPGALVVIGDSELRLVAGAEAAAKPRTEMRTSIGAPSSIQRVADAVEPNEWSPDILGVSDEPGTLTVMFTDIEASTERAVRMGDQGWYELLGRHHEHVTAHVSAHRGRIVKHQGDGYMCCFRSARAALLACIGIQRDLARQAEADPVNAIAVRMGLHTGEVLVADDGDLFGKHVVVAARVGAAASGGEVLVSAIVRQIAEPRGDIAFVDPQSLALKGFADAEMVWTVDWRGFPAPPDSAGA